MDSRFPCALGMSRDQPPGPLPLRRGPRSRWGMFCGGVGFFSFFLAALLGSPDANLPIADHDKAPFPSLDILRLKDRLNSPRQRETTRIAKARKQQAVMRSREEAARTLRCLPDVGIRTALQSFAGNGIRVVPKLAKSRNKACRQVLVPLGLHEILGRLGIGRSSSAEAAANAITARTSCSVSVGKS